MNFPAEKIVRRRRLAFNSEVLVHEGDRVRPDTVVAITMLPLPRLFFLSAFRTLPKGNPEGYSSEWLKSPGDKVDLDEQVVRFTLIDHQPGEVILPGGIRAEEPRKRAFKSPLPGIIENIVEETGIVLLREEVDYSARSAVVEAGFRLKVYGRKLKRCLRRGKGDFVEKGQILAQKAEAGDESSPGEIAMARAPIAGSISDIDLERGLIRIVRDFKEVELAAGFFGRVTAIDEEAIEITAEGRRAQGICGIGGESFGQLRVAVRNPADKLTGENITPSDAGMILVGGAGVTPKALKEAAETGVAGIITGGADHMDLCEFLGRDFAVAITGSEKAPFPVIITSEFGESPMDEELFGFFKEHQRSWAHLNPTTHMRAGVIRPEIIIMSGEI